MIKDILVVLEGGAEDATRLAYAESLATVDDGVVTGLFLNKLPELYTAVGPVGVVEVINDAIGRAREYGDTALAGLKPKFERLAARGQLRRLDSLAGVAGVQLAEEARVADITIITRPYGVPEGAPDLVEGLIFGSGRATLLVPPGGTPPKSYDTIVMAWSGTKDSARALREALPLLRKARQVRIVMVQEKGDPESRREQPGADVARHLDRHGVNVDLHTVTGWTDVAGALLHEAQAQSADLLVMGAYGHSRFRQWMLGGVTREILSTARLPVLVAH